ncbi:Mismatch-binding protein cmb1 [Ancistrocladus abbreviatus]
MLIKCQGAEHEFAKCSPYYVHLCFQTQFMLDQLADLQRKEEVLLESNAALKLKLEESTALFRSPPDAAAQNMQYARQPGDQPEGFFEPLPCNNTTLQIGFNPVVLQQMNPATAAQNINGFGAGWML